MSSITTTEKIKIRFPSGHVYIYTLVNDKFKSFKRKTNYPQKASLKPRLSGREYREFYLPINILPYLQRFVNRVN